MTIQNIIDGVADALSTLNKTMYVNEVKQGYQNGDILIHVVDASIQPMMTLRYRGSVQIDVIQFNDVKTDAYAMGQQIIDLLEVISTDDGMIRGSNYSYNYTDGALHVLATYDVSVQRPETPETKMHTLTTTEGVK